MSPETDPLMFAKLVMAPGAVTEVRVIGVPRVDIVCCWFDTPERLAEAIGEADRLRGTGAFVTMDPVNAALLGRRANRLARVGRRDSTTADKDILFKGISHRRAVHNTPHLCHAEVSGTRNTDHRPRVHCADRAEAVRRLRALVELALAALDHRQQVVPQKPKGVLSDGRTGAR